MAVGARARAAGRGRRRRERRAVERPHRVVRNGDACARSAPAPLSGCTVTTASASVEPRFDSVTVWSRGRERRRQARAVPGGRERAAAPGAAAASTGATAARSTTGASARRRRRRASATITTTRINARRGPCATVATGGHAASPERAGVRRTPVRRHITTATIQSTISSTISKPGSKPDVVVDADRRVRGNANAFVQSNAARRARDRGPPARRVPAAGRPLRPRATCRARPAPSRSPARAHRARRAPASLPRRDVEPAAPGRARSRCVLAGTTARRGIHASLE